MRGKRPFVFTHLREGIGLDDIVAFIEHDGMLAEPSGPPISAAGD